MFKPVCLVFSMAALATVTPAYSAPRVVSLNPCVDAVLMHVADPVQIAGISHYSHDKRATSIPLAQARRFFATSGTAEEVVALKPDIVLSGSHLAPATIAALNRMRIRLEQFSVPDSVAESTEQVRQIAALLGHPQRGAALAARIEASARPMPRTDIPALVWQSGGLVPGGNTLTDDLLKRAGFRNMSANYGLKKWDVLPMEYLIANPPRVLLSPAAAVIGEERAADHPALRRLAQHIAIHPYESRLMNCGGPTIISAMERLGEIRRNTAP